MLIRFDIYTNIYTFATTFMARFCNSQISNCPQIEVNRTKNNTPSRLTSVAHLGGILFYKAFVL